MKYFGVGWKGRGKEEKRGTEMHFLLKHECFVKVVSTSVSEKYWENPF